MVHNDTDLPQLNGDGTQEESSEVKRAVPAWIVSFVCHAVVLGFLSLIVYATKQEVDEPAVRQSRILPVPPEIDKKPLERVVDVTEIPIDIPVDSEKPSPVTHLDVPVEVDFSREDPSDSEVPKGRPDAISDAETGGPGLLLAIGAGGGASGGLGRYDGGGRKTKLAREGGTPVSEKAVDAALRWFKKHQSQNGQWDVDGYPANCQEDIKCEPGGRVTDENGDGAATSYAVLCYLGAGYDHRMPSKYKPTVKKGIDWLVSIQKPDGAFGNQNYVQGIATMALAEAYAMTNDPKLKEPAQKAVDVILQRQTADKAGGYGLGWDYLNPNPARADASVSGWCVMALKAAASGGLSIGNGMGGAKQYLERAWKAANKDFKSIDPYTDETTFPYSWNSETDAVLVERGSQHHDMAAVGALMAVFLGHKADDPMLNSMANYIMKHQFPTAYPCNTYYMYYNTLAMFQVDGERWKKWNSTGRDLLVNSQRKGNGCFDGSWDWEGTHFPGHDVGRIFSTAYCCLSLEVYYRYPRFGKAARR